MYFFYFNLLLLIGFKRFALRFVFIQTITFFLQLHKVNVVTLAEWLKQRGIAVKSKDKKSDLTSKVKQYLALVPHE